MALALGFSIGTILLGLGTVVGLGCGLFHQCKRSVRMEMVKQFLEEYDKHMERQAEDAKMLPENIDASLLPLVDQIPIYHPSLAVAHRLNSTTSAENAVAHIVGARFGSALGYYVIKNESTTLYSRAKRSAKLAGWSASTMARVDRFERDYQEKEFAVMARLKSTDLDALFRDDPKPMEIDFDVHGYPEHYETPSDLVKCTTAEDPLCGHPRINAQGELELFPTGYYDNVFAGFTVGPIYDASNLDLASLVPASDNGMGGNLIRRGLGEEYGAVAHTLGSVVLIGALLFAICVAVLTVRMRRRCVRLEDERTERVGEESRGKMPDKVCLFA